MSDIIFNGPNLLKVNKTFKEHFNVSFEKFEDRKYNIISMKVNIDIIKFDDWCKSNGMDEDKESIAQFVERKYSIEARDFVMTLL